MHEFNYESKNEEQTIDFAQKLAEKLQPGTVITLEGDLGAGKTTFTKGLAKGLNIKRTVNSPTFTIVKEYTQGTLPLYHMDVYRLEESEEDLGFEEYFYGSGVTVVEWAQFIKDQLPEELLNIEILRKGDEERVIKIQPKGIRYLQLCEELFKNESIGN